MRKIIALIIMLFSLTSTCFAINPLLSSSKSSVIPDNTDRWKLIYMSPDSFVIFVDSENYIPTFEALHTNCRMADAWEWHVRLKKDFSGFEDTYSILNIIYDFSCKTISIKRIIEYDRNGKMLGDFSYRGMPERIIPSSEGELIFKAMNHYDTHK